MTRPQLRDCLASVILDDPATWLGEPSPRMLQAFLDGAKTRAELTRQTLESWRVYGPLDEPDFYLPIVARTGHPTLSIRWATALESLNYSMLDSMLELKALIARWFEERGFDSGSRVGQPASDADLPRLLRRLARRPGLFLGEPCGWSLHCYLAGMDRGGDWLGLPPLPGLREVVDGIAERSLESYGSTFAAYRIYNRSPEELLAWVGIKPA